MKKQTLTPEIARNKILKVKTQLKAGPRRITGFNPVALYGIDPVALYGIIMPISTTTTTTSRD